MAAYRRVYDSRHLQADCQELGLAPEPYARYLYPFKQFNVIRSTFRMLMFAFLQQHFSRPWSLDIKVKLLLRSMLKLPSSVPHAIDPIENNKSRTVKRPLTLSCETYGYLACGGALHWPFPIPQRAEVKKQSQPEWLHTKNGQPSTHELGSLLRDAMHPRYQLWPCVRLSSVCLSVRHKSVFY